MKENISVPSAACIVCSKARESRERCDQLTQSTYKKPELLATAPISSGVGHYQAARTREVTYFYLYVILDVFSRYVTGWMVAMRESAELAKRRIEESCQKQCIPTGPAYAACRSWHLDEIQARGFFTGRPGCNQDSQPPTRLE